MILSTVKHSGAYNGLSKKIGRCVILRRNIYLPEGQSPHFPAGQPLAALRDAMEKQTVLSGTAIRCSSSHELLVRLGDHEGIIPRAEAVHPSISGAQRDISVLSRVGKDICFTVADIRPDTAGQPKLLLSRRAAQEQAIAWLLENAAPGTVLPARVTHLAAFGAFVDLGCGVISMIPLEHLSISRIRHSADRLRVGMDILVLVKEVDRAACRFYLGHRELLGTWAENAALFSPGDTVTGIVRDVRDYGVFIELAPNLSGLADPRQDLTPGDLVTVYIRSIRPDVRKIKLQYLQSLGPAPAPEVPRYFITEGPVVDWVY